MARSVFGSFALGAYEPPAGWAVSVQYVVRSADEQENAAVMAIAHSGTPTAVLYRPPLGTQVVILTKAGFVPVTRYIEPSGTVVEDWAVQGKPGPVPIPTRPSVRRDSDVVITFQPPPPPPPPRSTFVTLLMLAGGIGGVYLATRKSKPARNRRRSR